MRRIPPTIASQHPDNAFAPYWDPAGRPFVSVYQEIGEAVSSFKDLGVSEYMWDWEGKHADAAVIDRLLTDHHDYFMRHQLGRDKFLTFRIPNIWEEKGYNLLQAMTVVLSGEDLARDLGLRQRPLFEVILPMTERAGQLLHMQELFEKLADFKSKDFTPDQTANTRYLELIPLVEDVEGQMKVGRLLDEYARLHRRHFGRLPEYVRVFLACSDSSLAAGFLAAVLGNKLAVAGAYDFAARTGVEVFPFLGAGSLPFRGGLSPRTVDRFVEEFAGVRTVTVQSSFRYDHPPAEVKAAIARLERLLPRTRYRPIEPKHLRQLQTIARQATEHYKATMLSVVGDMQPIFKAVPKRRDRRQHIGLLAYARSMSGQDLPRAITFTAGFYSLGVPPEFIGIGRTLKGLTPAQLDVLQEHYPNLRADYEAAGRFLNADNLASLARRSPAWRQIQEDVQLAEQILDVRFGPRTTDEKAHKNMSANTLVFKNKPAALTELIEALARLRRSIG